jgi:hypothetical protein
MHTVDGINGERPHLLLLSGQRRRVGGGRGGCPVGPEARGLLLLGVFGELLLARRGVAAQVAFESRGLKPQYHLIGLNV